MTAYQSYLKSDHWQNLRLEKLVNCGAKCHFCHAESIHNDVHHVRYPKSLKDTKLRHLRVMCRRCHEWVHEILKEFPAINKVDSTRARWRITVQHMNRRLGYKMPFPSDSPEEREERRQAMMYGKARLRAARQFAATAYRCPVTKKATPLTEEFAEWLTRNEHADHKAVLLMAAALGKTGFTTKQLLYRVRAKWWKRHLYLRHHPELTT